MSFRSEFVGKVFKVKKHHTSKQKIVRASPDKKNPRPNTKTQSPHCVKKEKSLPSNREEARVRHRNVVDIKTLAGKKRSPYYVSKEIRPHTEGRRKKFAHRGRGATRHWAPVRVQISIKRDS